MVDRKKLNTNVMLARNGDSVAEEEVIKLLMPIVLRLSEQVWHLLHDQTSFEQACYKLVRREVRKLVGTPETFLSHITWKFRGLRNHYICKRRYRRENLLSIDRSGGDGSIDKDFDVEDDLAIVDDDILTNEKIALLAEDDPRKLAILREWTGGCYNDSETALLLAQKCGGKPESHRKFITRFRSHCQKALAYAN